MTILGFIFEKIVPVAACLLLTACHQLKGLSDRHDTNVPNRAEIVGKWTIDGASLQRMKSVQAFYHLSKINPDENVLIFRSDGSCSFKTYSSFDSDDYYLSSEGQWSLKMEETVGGSGIQRPAVVIELRPDASSHVFTHFWIVREGGRLVLWNYIGDPDYERYADFHKENR